MRQGIRHIRAFLTIARLNSFTRSATELHISQPALTVQIRQLEESLGVRLFDRNKRQVVLTRVGEHLFPYLSRVLTDLETVMNISQELANLKCGSVSIATLPSVAAGLLPKAIRHFSADYPEIDVHVSDVVAKRVIQLVKTEEVDFGIGALLETDDADIEAEEFLTDRLCVFFPKKHPLSENPLPVLQNVAAYPLILTASGTSVRTLVDRALEKERIRMNLACESSYMSTAIGMVRAGMGVSILPESAVCATSCEGIRMMPIQTTGLTRKIHIIHKKNRSLSPAANCFVQTLKKTVQKKQP